MTTDSFTKLSAGILASTVWQEPNSTRIVWITMLALADRNGEIAASIPGLAHLARVSIQEAETALQTFMAPDPYSRTPDNEGRRVEACMGGWRLLNHAAYRARRDSEETRERKRQWDRENRPSGHARSADSPTQSDAVRPNRPSPTQAEADTEAEKEQKHEQKRERVPRSSVRFEEFWTAYPNKKGKKDAEAAWKRKALDAHADAILTDVKRRQRADRDWLKGFIPHGSTYVNAEGWRDGLPPADGVVSTPPSTVEALTGPQIHQKLGIPEIHLTPEQKAERVAQARAAIRGVG